MSNISILNIVLLIIIIILCTIYTTKQILYIKRLEKRRKIMESFSNRVNEMSIEEMLEEFKGIDENDKLLNEYYFYTILHQIFIRGKEK